MCFLEHLRLYTFSEASTLRPTLVCSVYFNVKQKAVVCSHFPNKNAQPEPGAHECRGGWSFCWWCCCFHITKEAYYYWVLEEVVRVDSWEEVVAQTAAWVKHREAGVTVVLGVRTYQICAASCVSASTSHTQDDARVWKWALGFLPHKSNVVIYMRAETWSPVWFWAGI